MVPNCGGGGGGGVGIQVDLKKIPLVSEKRIILLQIFNRFFSLSWINISELAHVCVHISTLLFICYFYVVLLYRSLPFPSTSHLLSHTII